MGKNQLGASVTPHSKEGSSVEGTFPACDDQGKPNRKEGECPLAVGHKRCLQVHACDVGNQHTNGTPNCGHEGRVIELTWVSFLELIREFFSLIPHEGVQAPPEQVEQTGRHYGWPDIQEAQNKRKGTQHLSQCPDHVEHLGRVLFDAFQVIEMKETQHVSPYA